MKLGTHMPGGERRKPINIEDRRTKVNFYFYLISIIFTSVIHGWMTYIGRCKSSYLYIQLDIDALELLDCSKC
jgi:hypothetical protein